MHSSGAPEVRHRELRSRLAGPTEELHGRVEHREGLPVREQTGRSSAGHGERGPKSTIGRIVEGQLALVVLVLLQHRQLVPGARPGEAADPVGDREQYRGCAAISEHDEGSIPAQDQRPWPAGQRNHNVELAHCREVGHRPDHRSGGAVEAGQRPVRSGRSRLVQLDGAGDTEDNRAFAASVEERQIFLVRRYQHPELGELFGVYVTPEDEQFILGYGEILYVARKDEKLQIVSRYRKGMPGGGLPWEWMGGERIDDPGEPVEVRKLLSPDLPEDRADYEGA